MDDTPQPIYSSEQVSTVNSKSHSTLTLIISSVLMLLVGLGGGYYYARMNTLNETQAIIPTPSTIPTSTDTNPDMSGWKYYEGAQNFEFKYPADWSQSGSSITSPSGDVLSVVVNEPGLDGPCPEKTNSENITVNGFQITKEYYRMNTENEDCQGSDVSWAVATVINDKDQIQLILTFHPQQKSKVLDQFNRIVNTFSFTFAAAEGTNPVYETTLCQNDNLKIAIDVPKEFTCDSSRTNPSTITLSSSYFGIEISDAGRGGPCPLYGDEANATTQCTKKQWYANDTVTVDTYSENGKMIAFFGRVGEDDPNKNLIWINIVPKDKAGTPPTGDASNQLILLLDSIHRI